MSVTDGHTVNTVEGMPEEEVFYCQYSNPDNASQPCPLGSSMQKKVIFSLSLGSILMYFLILKPPCFLQFFDLRSSYRGYLHFKI